jgi:hypothetical protein
MLGELRAGVAGPAPPRDASRWNSVHSAEMAGEGVGVTSRPEEAEEGALVEVVHPVMRTTTKKRAALGITDPS